MAELYSNDFEKLDESKKKIMYRAMELSKGKANNERWLEFLNSTTIESEDIAKISGGIEDDTEINRKIWNENHRQRIAKDRGRLMVSNEYASKVAYKDKVARMYSIEDTFLYRAYKNCGLDLTGLEQNVHHHRWYISEIEMDRAVKSVGDRKNTFDKLFTVFEVSRENATMGYGDSSVTNSYVTSDIVDILCMFYSANKDLRKRITADDKLNKFFSRNAKIRRNMGHVPNNISHTYTDEEFRGKQKEWVIQEFDWLAHLNENDKELRDKFLTKNLEHNYRYDTDLFTGTVLSSFRYPSSDLAMEIIGEAFNAMAYLGIGCLPNADNDKVGRNGSMDGYRGSQLLKKVCSSVRLFNRDVKKGISVEDAREILVEDLNNWVKGQVRDLWRFVIRTDAPEHYPELEPKKKEKPERVTKADITENTKKKSKIIEVNNIEEFINLTKE